MKLTLRPWRHNAKRISDYAKYFNGRLDLYADDLKQTTSLTTSMRIVLTGVINDLRRSIDQQREIVALLDILAQDTPKKPQDRQRRRTLTDLRKRSTALKKKANTVFHGGPELPRASTRKKGMAPLDKTCLTRHNRRQRQPDDPEDSQDDNK